MENNGSKVPDWSSVDWSKTNNLISEELCCPVGVVSYYRQVVGKPRCVFKSRVDWQSLDWTKPDSVLCRENSVGLQKVKTAREVLGMPKVNGNEVKRVVSEEMIESMDWLTTKDATIARMWHVSGFARSGWNADFPTARSTATIPCQLSLRSG